ncbi:hypothetical protein [Streptomyces sp. GESEQ-35]|uniref:hypothetical protein n=1 Tax=Streptomyces sp. GESEQ-35 TaxID=2812657 RepID=UPI001B3228AB|nr:hypothetical protein [Streptomyces sp. GESEQ-35]
MGWFKGLVQRRRSVGAAPTGVCDSCNAVLDRTAGYFVSTRDVVLSRAYWKAAFEQSKPMVDAFGLADGQLLQFFQDSLHSTAGQQSPWSICEDCSEMFVFDRDSGRSHAVRNTRPPGSGKVDPSGCVLFAAAGWEQVFGRWPANVTPEAVMDSCDLCRASMYSGEFTFTVPEDRMGEFRGNGFVDGDPVCPPRPDKGGWVICHTCAARLFARFHRASHTPE